MSTTLPDRTEAIRTLNDAFRTGMDQSLGRIMLTDGIAGLPSDVQAMMMRKTATFDAFDDGNDPHQEHDFGAFDIAGHKVFWKIDYYDPQLVYGSDDPTDPAQSTRVLTIMLAEEY